MKTFVLSMTLILLWLSVLGSDCSSEEVDKEIHIYTMTDVPPGHDGLLLDTEDEQYLSMTQGMIWTFNCWDTCDYECPALNFEIKDPDLIEIMELYQNGSQDGYVILAKKVGHTQWTISDKCASKTFEVEIKPLEE